MKKSYESVDNKSIWLNLKIFPEYPISLTYNNDNLFEECTGCKKPSENIGITIYIIIYNTTFLYHEARDFINF